LGEVILFSIAEVCNFGELARLPNYLKNRKLMRLF